MTLYEPALCEGRNPSARRLLRDGLARISEQEKSGVILNHDAEDRLIAIEILDASTRVDGVDTVELQVTPRPGTRRPEAAE